MKTLIKSFFLNNWQRKLISFLLAIIIWLLVNHSLISEKTYSNIPVKIKNVANGMVIPGLKTDGNLEDTINLKIVAYKKVLDQLSPDDIQVVLDASSKDTDWVAIIQKKEVKFSNSLINPYPYIRTIEHEPFVISVVKSTSE
ncbi:MAG: hypothetical protein S4CHLAM7_02620 [Chlamydiae bacterium]|nr:hypothetical protein [Chlamydiota bacterium]